MNEGSVQDYPGYDWRVSDDRLSVLFRADDQVVVEISPESVASLIKSKGIVAEIELPTIESAINDQRGQWVPIAHGLPPVPPVDASLEYLVDLNQMDLGPQADSTGKVDYKRLQHILNVTEGQELIRKNPGVPGQPGEDVYGEPVQPAEPRDIQIPRGDGIRIVEDGMLAVAEIDGAVVAKRQEAISRRHSGEVVELFEDEDERGGLKRVRGSSVRALSVTKVHKVVGDVSLRTGNINFNGTVHITGNVPSGFEIIAEGDVIVGGLIEGAVIKAKGNVKITGGIQGGGRAEVTAGESIAARFASEAVLVAGQEVVMNSHLMNCQVFAGASVRIESPHGLIAGGRVRADSKIITGLAGTEIGVKTILQIGREDNLLSRIGEAEGKIEELTKRLGEIQEILMRLNAIKQAQGTLPQKHETVRIRAVQNQFAIMGQLDQVNKQLVTFKRLLEKNRAGVVEIHQVAHAGVVVLFPGATYNLKHSQKHFACYYSKGEIHSRAL